LRGDARRPPGGPRWGLGRAELPSPLRRGWGSRAIRPGGSAPVPPARPCCRSTTPRSIAHCTNRGPAGREAPVP